MLYWSFRQSSFNPLSTGHAQRFSIRHHQNKSVSIPYLRVTHSEANHKRKGIPRFNPLSTGHALRINSDGLHVAHWFQSPIYGSRTLLQELQYKN